MANIKKYIGSKAFYRSVLAVAVPIMIQNGITNFVSLLDNIMVGRLGTEVMSGVSIVNQLLFVLQLLLFGAVSAAGIFTAQYHGTGNNEGLWVFGMTFRNQIYSGAGLTVVAAQNICLTVAEVFDIVYKSLGSAIAIILGNHLGADRIEEAKDANRKMIAFSMCCTVVISGLLIALSPLFPRIYNTTDEVRSLATFMIIITAAATPFAAFGYCSYFTLRSGGKILVTMLFDSIFMCFFVAPLAYLLMNIVGLEIHTAFIIVTFTDIIKALIGYLLLRRGDWANKLVE